jgi:hypothetical protein
VLSIAHRSGYPTRGLSARILLCVAPSDAPSFTVACALEVDCCSPPCSSRWQSYGLWRIFGTMQVDSIDRYPYQRCDMACLADSLVFPFDPRRSSRMRVEPFCVVLPFSFPLIAVNRYGVWIKGRWISISLCCAPLYSAPDVRVLWIEKTLSYT